MPRYLLLHNAPVAASKFMAAATPEQRQAGMDAWIAWKNEAEKTIKFEFGMPVEAVGRVSHDGTVVKSDSQASGYSIIEGSKEDVMNALKTHPHLERPDASIDVLEMLSMPGM